jgi:hypothetical protein
LGQNQFGHGHVVEADGFEPRVVSTHAVENHINSYARIDNAQADVYSDRGHTFYVLSFPNGKISWTYDLATRLWHERGTWIAEDNEYIAWRPRWHALAFGEHRILDSETGEIYRMGSTLTAGAVKSVEQLRRRAGDPPQYSIDSRPIRRLRRSPAIQNEHGRVFYSAFELDMESGVAESTGQGSNPQVMLRISDDGGRTWGNEHWTSAGKIGEYTKRVRWNRLGTARRRVFEVSVTDPVPWALTDAYVELAQ